MAAPKGNLNHLRNGGRMTRLICGQLPAKLRRYTANAQKYRRGLEAAVLEEKGEVDLTDAHAIDQATSAEMHAGVCRWLLKHKIETMKATDILACSKNIMLSKESRNRAFKALKLGKTREDLLDNLYNVPHSPVSTSQDDNPITDTQTEEDD